MPSHFRHTAILLVLLGLLFVLSAALAKPTTSVARAAWRAGGSATSLYERLPSALTTASRLK